jgi:hypothetical protein
MRTHSANVKSTSIAPARAAVLSPVAVSCFNPPISACLRPACAASGAGGYGHLPCRPRLQRRWQPMRASNAANFIAVSTPPIRPTGSWKRKSNPAHN